MGYFLTAINNLEDAERSGLAADPADLASQRLTDVAGLADAGIAEDHQQVQMPGREGADVAFQLRVAPEADGVLR